VRKIKSTLGGQLAGRRLGVLGLAFKANTDDMRDAPSLTILPQLIAEAPRCRLRPVASHQASILLAS